MSLREAARRPFPPRAGKERKLKPYVDFLPSRAYSLFSPPCPRCSLTLRQAGSVSLERGLEENGPAKKNPGLGPGSGCGVILKAPPVSGEWTGCAAY